MKRKLLYLFLFSITVTAVLLSSQMSAAVRETVAFCIATLIPSLFPFLVLSKILISSGFCASLGKLLSPLTVHILGLTENSGGVFAIGLLSGYPIGASSAAQLLKSGGCTKNEAQRLLCFCNNCGPAFMIGAVGGALGNAKTGLLLWVIQLVSVMLAATVLRFARRHIARERRVKQKNDIQLDIVTAVHASMGSMAVICAFAVFFSAVCGILRATDFLGVMGILRMFLTGDMLMCAEKLIYGLLEVTSAVSVYAEKTPLLLAATAFACTFGGASVHMQTAAVCANSGLSMKKYVMAKLVQGIIAFTITLVTASLAQL